MTYELQPRVSARLHTRASQVSRPGVGGIVVTGDATGGHVSILRSELTPGSEIAAHYHRTFAESFYVLAGEVRFWDGATWLSGIPGDLFHIPPGGLHALRNESDRASEALVLSTPGVPRERYVLELLEIHESGRALSPAEWQDFYARHDQFTP
jgi:quercetin dioxygenase-like cupin family protein